MPNPPLADLIEYDTVVPWKSIKRVPLERLRKQHAKRWKLSTSLGEVVLKKLSQLDLDRISIELVTERPEYLEIIDRVKTLKEFADGGVPLNPEHIDELNSLGQKLIPFQRQFSRACFVDYVCDRCMGEGRINWNEGKADCPKCQGSGAGSKEVPMFKTEETYDAFLSSLQPQEVDKLYRVLEELTSAQPPGEVSSSVIAICKEFGIPLADDLTGENMTAEQMSVLTKMITDGEAELKKRMEAANRNASV